MYQTIVDETCSCRLLIMFGDGPRCKVLGDNSFSAIDPMLLQEIFQTSFSISSNENKRRKKEKKKTTYRGAKCWVTVFSQRIDPVLLQELF